MKWMCCLAVACLLIAGCSSRVYVQRSESANMAKYRTYSWVETKAHEDDQNINRSAFADISVRKSVREALEQEGWKEVSDNPDILMGYDILVERSSVQQNEPVYSRPFTRVYYNPYMRRWGRIYYPSQFLGYDTYTVPVKEATLTLTMMDAKTDETVWQGWTTERINTTRITDDEIDKSIKNILKKLDAE